jgi:hypothetical protein
MCTLFQFKLSNPFDQLQSWVWVGAAETEFRPNAKTSRKSSTFALLTFKQNNALHSTDVYFCQYFN